MLQPLAKDEKDRGTFIIWMCLSQRESKGSKEQVVFVRPILKGGLFS